MSEYNAELRVSFERWGPWLVGQIGGGRSIRLDHYGICSQQHGSLTPLAEDLLRLVSAVYASDRLVRRKTRDRCGTRKIKLCVDVSEPAFWREATILNITRNIVEFLSDDEWELRFSGYREKSDVQTWLNLPSPPSLCLYSGGLDSAAGLATRLSLANEPLLAVTARHQPRQRQRVENQLHQIGLEYGAAIHPVFVKVAMVRPPPLRRQELTQRCRSMLFAAIAGAVAASIGANEIEVYENGIGAFNLPHLRGMATCAKTTRSSHPHFLSLMSLLVSRISGRDIRYVLPHIYRTKTELVRSLATRRLYDVARSTVSCVHYPLRGHVKQCGVCAACILSRQAFFSAGIVEQPYSYAYDFLGNAGADNTVQPEKLDFLKAILIQVDRYAELGNRPAPDWLRTYLLGTKAIGSPAEIEQVIDLHLRYRSEWMELAARGRASGWQWSQWLVPEVAA